MMMAQAKTMDGVADVPAGAVPVTGNWTREFVWSVRRELWEHRAIFWVPLAASGLMLLGFVIFAAQTGRTWGQFGPERYGAAGQDALDLVGQVSIGAALLVAVFYCLDALYGERRDRSILFWKSLPVSDLTVVLSKMTVPVVVIPAVCFAVTLATQAVLLLLGAVLMRFGVIPPISLHEVPLGHRTAMLLVRLIALDALWYAPIYAWLLLASAWAKRTSLLWAVLPPAGIAVVEQIAFHTAHFALLLKSRFNGSGSGLHFTAKSVVTDGMSQLDLLGFLRSPGLWGGLFVTGLFLAGAVRLRRYRGPI